MAEDSTETEVSSRCEEASESVMATESRPVAAEPGNIEESAAPPHEVGTTDGATLAEGTRVAAHGVDSAALSKDAPKASPRQLLAVRSPKGPRPNTAFLRRIPPQNQAAEPVVEVWNAVGATNRSSPDKDQETRSWERHSVSPSADAETNSSYSERGCYRAGQVSNARCWDDGATAAPHPRFKKVYSAGGAPTDAKDEDDDRRSSSYSERGCYRVDRSQQEADDANTLAVLRSLISRVGMKKKRSLQYSSWNKLDADSGGSESEDEDSTEWRARADGPDKDLMLRTFVEMTSHPEKPSWWSTSNDTCFPRGSFRTYARSSTAGEPHEAAEGSANDEPMKESSNERRKNAKATAWSSSEAGPKMDFLPPPRARPAASPGGSKDDREFAFTELSQQASDERGPEQSTGFHQIRRQLRARREANAEGGAPHGVTAEARRKLRQTVQERRLPQAAPQD